MVSSRICAERFSFVLRNFPRCFYVRGGRCSFHAAKARSGHTPEGMPTPLWFATAEALGESAPGVRLVLGVRMRVHRTAGLAWHTTCLLMKRHFEEISACPHMANDRR